MAVSFFFCEDQLFGDMLKCLLGVVRCIRDGDAKPEDASMDPVVNIKMLLSKSLFYQLCTVSRIPLLIVVNCEQVKPDCSKAFEKYIHEQYSDSALNKDLIYALCELYKRELSMYDLQNKDGPYEDIVKNALGTYNPDTYKGTHYEILSERLYQIRSNFDEYCILKKLSSGTVRSNHTKVNKAISMYLKNQVVLRMIQYSSLD